MHPPPGTVGSSNDRSLVMVAEAFGRRVLLTGDVTRAAEMRLVEADVAVDVLKVAHHGSRTSTSELFLRAARPRSASISVGVRNAYGHPAPEVLDRLRAHRIHALRTDRDGMITWRFDERGARVRISGRGLAAGAGGGPVPVVLPSLE